MWSRPGILLVCGVLVLAVSTASAQTPADQFELARNAFDYQDYPKVVELLVPLLNPEPKLPSAEQVQQAREWLGAARYWQGDKVGFKEEFTRLLKSNPDFELDSFYYPPEMVADFNKHKAQLVELGVIATGAVKLPEPKPVTRTITIEKTVARHSPVINWVPFGAGQFANGALGKGAFFATAEGLLLGANIGSWLYLYSAQPHGAARTAGLWTMYSSVAAFAAFAVWGIIDAHADFIPEELIDEKRLEKEGESASMMPIVPVLLEGGGFGLGFEGTF